MNLVSGERGGGVLNDLFLVGGKLIAFGKRLVYLRDDRFEAPNITLSQFTVPALALASVYAKFLTVSSP